MCIEKVLIKWHYRHIKSFLAERGITEYNIYTFVIYIY